MIDGFESITVGFGASLERGTPNMRSACAYSKGWRESERYDESQKEKDKEGCPEEEE